MKKSELKSIIREMIQEELSKMNEAAALQESTEVVTEDVETITEEVVTEELPAAEAVKEEPAEEPAESEAPVEEAIEEPAEVVEESCDKEDCVEEAVDGRTGASLVKANTYQDIASDIYNSDEFRGAFAIDGTVYGDEVNLVIEDALMSAYPTLSDEKFAGAVTSITKHLSEFVAGEDEVADADFYSDDAFADLDRIYKDHFDSEGNAY